VEEICDGLEDGLSWLSYHM